MDATLGRVRAMFPGRNKPKLFALMLGVILLGAGSGLSAVPRAQAATTPIYQHWLDLGGPSSALGNPTTSEATTGDGIGRIQYFERGIELWSPSTGAWEVHGAILAHYTSLSLERGPLGYPVTDETPTPDRIGRFNHFQVGSIYWTPSTGAREVQGAIRDRWASLGWERSVLGYPTSDETDLGCAAGKYNNFQGGAITWSPSVGAHETHGAIRSRWASLGFECGILGLPTTDETTTPDGIGRYNHFESGSIYWTPSTGAWEVHGAIRARWASLGWELGVLGYPVTNETTTPDRSGRYNHFQLGSIYWSPSTGAWEVHGAVRAKWASMGWESGFLRYPISNETPVGDGLGRVHHFQGGVIYWSLASGAWSVKGSILQTYAGLGGPQSGLGYPLTDETPTATGASSTFQGGHIDFIRATGAITVTYTPAAIIRRGSPSRSMIALTFDAGSDAGSAGAILDLLSARGIHATFGLTGVWAQANPDLVRRMVNEGDQLLNHTWDHSSFTGYSTRTAPLTSAERVSQLSRADQFIAQLTGATTKPWFRPPYGDTDASVQADAAAAGYHYEVMWTVDSLGWEGIPASQVIANVMSGVAPGAIILMHVGSGSTDCDALPTLIDRVQAAGYAFGTVAQVL